MANKGADFEPGADLPKLDKFIFATSRRQELAVRTKGYGGDLPNVTSLQNEFGPG
jgi:hypothetical protein